MDWERRRIELQWYAAGFRQELRARWVLRRVSKLGRRAKVLGDPRVDGSDVEIGDDFIIWQAHRQTIVSGGGKIRIGDRVFFNSGTTVLSVVEVTIGDDVALANEVYVMDSNSHGVEGRPHVDAPVHIGAGTWVGARAMILPGVTIGKRVLVAAGSVVTRDVPDDVLVGGNPARVIRPLNYPPGCRRAWHDAWCPCPKIIALEGSGSGAASSASAAPVAPAAPAAAATVTSSAAAAAAATVTSSAPPSAGDVQAAGEPA